MGRTTQPFVSAKIGSRLQNKSRRDDAAVPAVSSRTSFARCSNFLLSQKRSDTTVIADRASHGGLGMSGSGWSRQGRTNGTSESFLCPFGTSDPGMGRHVQATQDGNSRYPRTVPVRTCRSFFSAAEGRSRGLRVINHRYNIYSSRPP